MDQVPAVSGTSTGQVGVFVLDDNDLVRAGLEELISGTDGLALVGEAATAAQALARIPGAAPDVALFDIVLPDGNGVDVCREVRSHHPEVVCLLLTFHDDEEALLAAVMAGAAGYLTKQVQGSRVVDSIRRAASGESLMDPACTGPVLAWLRNADVPGSRRQLRGPSPVARLSRCERQVLDLVVDGQTNTQIAARLSLAEATVKPMISVIFTQLSLERRAHAHT